MTAPMTGTPRTRLAPHAIDRVLELIAGVAIIWQIVMLVALWPRLPARVPVHFDATGQPDAFGTKFTILAIPLLTIGIYALLTIVARYPHRFRYPVEITESNAEVHYRLALRLLLVLKASFSVIFALLLMQSVAVASRTHFAPGWLLMMLVVAAPAATFLWYMVSAIRAQ